MRGCVSRAAPHSCPGPNTLRRDARRVAWGPPAGGSVLRRLRAHTGLFSDLSTSGLAVVATAVRARPHPDPVVAQRKAQFRVRGSVVFTPVGEEGPQGRPLSVPMLAASAHRREASGSRGRMLRTRDANGDAKSRDNGYYDSCRPPRRLSSPRGRRPLMAGGTRVVPPAPLCCPAPPSCPSERQQPLLTHHYDASRVPDLLLALLDAGTTGCRNATPCAAPSTRRRRGSATRVSPRRWGRSAAGCRHPAGCGTSPGARARRR